MILGLKPSVTGMAMNLEVLLYKWEGDNPKFKKAHAHFVVVRTPQKLKQLLQEKDFDLIVLGEHTLTESEISQIYRQFQVPFLVPESLDLKQVPKMAVCQQKKWVYEGDLQICVELHRESRQSVSNRFSIEVIKKFEQSIPYGQDEIVIAALRNYFKDVLNLDEVHWISIGDVNASVPPLLVLLAHLEKQKLEYTGLISDLESYESEYKNSGTWQIWQDVQQRCLALVWIEGRGGEKHCLVLNKIQNITLFHLANFMDSITLLLQKRWELCLRFADQEKLIYLDSLTSLYNQKYLSLTLDKKIEENRRYQNPFSILFIDIDYFKQVNDSLGHVVGSDVLLQLGLLIQGQVRASDYAFRYGGDEFIVLLSHTQGEPARLVAERIRSKVEGHTFQSSGHDISITVSIGLAFFPEHASSAVDIIRIADEAMYYGKNVSRNIVYKAS